MELDVLDATLLAETIDEFFVRNHPSRDYETKKPSKGLDFAENESVRLQRYRACLVMNLSTNPEE